ncbi:MAG: hypothetical protein JOY99_09810 [Sphingomonadaceae bacterium]|nr:hypothetical protein [Sphingomonadaceae bacterium]
MTEREGLSHHPAPKAEQLSTTKAWFMLAGGAGAWFVQLCFGYGLLSWSCYPYDIRLATPLPGYGGSLLATLIVSIACAIVALLSGYVSRRSFEEVKDEHGGSHEEHLHTGQGRTRFIAHWGMILGFSFAATIVATFVAFALVPRCAG